MAETIKSALLIDHDSLYRSLKAAAPEAAERFAARISAWIGAIEAGRLVTALDGTSEKRKVLLRRCYADPALLSDHRGAFIAAGFQVIDCPAQSGRQRNGADIHMALDTIEALEHPAAYDEFILLSAESDFTPVLMRLRTHNRSTVVYVAGDASENTSAIADGIFEEKPLIALLSVPQKESVAEASIPAGMPPHMEPPAADRTEIEALARRVSTATNVPLLSPKSFAELFRVLAEEIARNGYHFQKSAENVTETLVAGGRKVTRRQVVFVVKGLALKGHVFSNTDTPERLADVFREQVAYLIRNGNLEMTDRETAIMPAWITGRPGALAAASPGDIEPDLSPDLVEEPAAIAEEEEAPKPAPEPIAAKPVPPRLPPKPVDDQAARAARRKQGKPVVGSKSEPPPPPPTASKPVQTIRPPEPPRPVAAPPRAVQIVRPPSVLPKPIVATPRPAPQTPLAAAPAQQASAPPSSSRGVASISPKPAADRPTIIKPLDKPTPQADKDVVESSILAAIAQAVDVLVEDGAVPSARPAPPKAIETVMKVQPAPPPPPVEATETSGDDIGEEIQKIIASYNRDRQQGEPQ